MMCNARNSKRMLNLSRRRWDILLSNWIRDYVYLSLVGERGSQTDRVWAEPVPSSRVTSEKPSKSPKTFALYGTWALMGFGMEQTGRLHYGVSIMLRWCMAIG